MARPRKSAAKTPAKSPFDRWRERYLEAGRADKLAGALAFITRDGDALGLRDAFNAIQNNIKLAAFVLSFRKIDGRPVGAARFLRLQKYDVRGASAHYVVEFLSGTTRCWALVDELKEIDLSDLLGVLSFVEVRISHPNGSALRRGEHAQLEKRVTYDLRYDYSTSELKFEFNRARDCLQVSIEEA